MAQDKIVWSTAKRLISELTPAEYNPRQASEKETQDLKNSLERFDLADPIIINKNNTIIGGHFRVKVLEESGVEEIDVRIPSRQLTEEEEIELNLRLNKNSGSWNNELLANFSEDMLKQVGFSPEELDKIFDKQQTMEDDPEDGDGAGGQGIIEGDIFTLGKHRLMCGDAMNIEHVRALMNGEKAQLVFTDPPYNIDYDPNEKYAFTGANNTKVKSSIGSKILNDKMTDEEFLIFLTAAFNNYYEISQDDACIFVTHTAQTAIQFLEAFRDAKYHHSQTIIWAKENINPAMSQDYHRCYEPILFGWKEGNTHYTNHYIDTEKEIWNLPIGKFAEILDMWFIRRGKGKDNIHPTQKPVGLVERAIKRHSLRGQIMADFFAGSGSGLIACEQLERVCYSMEQDPVYMKKIITRWEQYTHNKAEKANPIGSLENA